jgi:PadR family transcriptional regulator PadR
MKESLTILSTYIDLKAMKSIRLSPQTLQVLDCFSQQPTAWLYGYELSRETGLKSGTLYPILMRLAKHELLETRWGQTEEGVPPRHNYRLTTKGVELVRSEQVRARKPLATRKPATAEGRG